MANTVIQLKKSSTPAATPSSLANGELAINYADGKLFYKNSAGYIVEISTGGGGGNSFGTVNANGTMVVSDTSGDILTLIAGSGINIVGDAINDAITISAPGASGLPNSSFTLEGNLTTKGNVVVLDNSVIGYSNTVNVFAYSFYNLTSKSIDTVFP